MLRFFTVYGPRQRPDLAIHKFTKAIKSGKKIQMYGDGTTFRDYTYIDDIINGVVGSINWIFTPSDEPKYEIFNLGESHTTSLKELISIIEKGLDKTANIEKLPLQMGDVNRTFADISKAKDTLGYNPTTLIEKGIPKFIEWFNNQRYLS